MLVGDDGSPGADLAVAWGTRRALRRDRVIELVQAVDRWPSSLVRDGEAQALEAADARLRERAGTLRTAEPALRVRTMADVARPVPLLLARAREADCVVVGARGHGEVHGLHLGHVGGHLAGHAPCPVVLVREGAGDGAGDGGGGGAGVVVGLEGGDTGIEDARLQFALEEAAAAGDGLCVVQAWQPAWVDLSGAVWPPEVEQAERERRAALLARVEQARERHPGVPVEVVLRPTHPVPALLEASRGRRLLVVGTHGLGAFAGMLLGSTSRSVMARADCSVAVVPTG